MPKIKTNDQAEFHIAGSWIPCMLLLLFLTLSASLNAKDYNASLFGVKSNGTTLNTNQSRRVLII